MPNWARFLTVCILCIHMGSKTIRLNDDVYSKLRAAKREDETFSETVERLIGAPSLTELAGILDSDTVDDMREAIDEADEADAEAVEEIVERFE